MRDGIAGDKSPPGDRIKPTFREVNSFAEHLMGVGTRANLQTKAAWLPQMSIVDERARSRKRTDDAVVTIETIDLDLMAWEIIEEAARRALPNDEALIALGLHEETRHKNLTERSKAAAEARGLTSGKNWRDTRRQEVVDVFARELYRSLYYPDHPQAETADDRKERVKCEG